MSAKLKWEPAKRKAESLPDALRFVLQRTRGLAEGRVTFNSSDIVYLRGLRDADVEGARELIEAIDTHGSVELWLEY